MGTRRHFKGIIRSLHDKFLARNNDLDGYWSLGVLYKDSALAGESSEVTINLLQCTSLPELSYIGDICRPFNKFICEQLDHYGLSLKLINVIEIKISFNVSKITKEQTMSSAWGEIFKVKVELIDDLNKKYTCESQGWCWRNNPDKEQRSIRRNLDTLQKLKYLPQRD